MSNSPMYARDDATTDVPTESHTDTRSTDESEGDWPAEPDAMLADAGITAPRFRRAVEQDMAVEETAPGICDVHSHSGNTYTVVFPAGSCTCPDGENRGPGCKHAIRAALELGRFDFERVLDACDVIRYNGVERAVLALGPGTANLTPYEIRVSGEAGSDRPRSALFTYAAFGECLLSGNIQIVEWAGDDEELPAPDDGESADSDDE